MKPLNDQELLDIYFNQASGEVLNRCLKDPKACQQLDQLSSEMKQIEDAFEQITEERTLPDQYGQQMWHSIESRLPEISIDTVNTKQSSSWLETLKSHLMRPQFSLASLVLVAGLVMVAFYSGTQQSHDSSNNLMSTEFQEQLLAQNIQLHLTQSEIFLTQVNNGQQGPNNQSTAQRLLASNRIFKQALTQYEGQYTHQVLQDLEPIFMEYANQNLSDSENQTHGQSSTATWVTDSKSTDLKFQIKAMKQKLAQKNDII